MWEIRGSELVTWAARCQHTSAMSLTRSFNKIVSCVASWDQSTALVLILAWLE